MVRAARRRLGVSQREMARRAGVSATSVVAIESGRQQPSLRVLQALLEVAGLGVCVDRPVQPLCAHVRRHLHRSLSIRLHLALGGNGRPWVHPVLPQWQQLGTLARSGRLFAEGELARALWLPVLSPVSQLVVGLECSQPAGTAAEPALPETPDVQVLRRTVPASCTVTVPLSIGSLRVPPPGELALDPAQAEFRGALRSVAGELELCAPRDPGGRRSPAHREPCREDESWRLLFARRWTPSFLPPDRLDGRGWRLDDEVGFQEWIDRRASRR